MSFQHSIRLVDGVLVVDGTGDPVDLWAALRAFFMRRRPVCYGADGAPYPETTMLEVLEVCAIYDRLVARVPRHARGEALEKQYWERVTRRAAAIASGHGFDDVYPENEQFWLRDAPRVAVFLMFASDRPTSRRVS